ncbi:AAA family ATPase [Aeoliella mucimassa]|uniref:DNA primase/polymerase bifunctional N-terminal domain-containing protein n=1 Tax=Aeoliella mucimassa TaxID=2527972 RepID=A0A518APR7_9BACT|nr:AAA family ATPase [Aeoliella mucimassa]QDU56719.1 hypothetical protein Pan181_29290 [Aeoliella mucimassa]
MKETPHWILWRDESGRKIPYCVGGGKASTTNPADWSTYSDAIAYYKQHGASFSGLGSVFTADDPFCGVDLDNCVDPATGEVSLWAADIIKEFGSYAEISPSGTGVKIFCEAKLPGDRGCRKAYADGVVEMYDQGRYFAVTGTLVDPEFVGCVPAQAAVDKWYGLLSSGANNDKGSTAELEVEDVSEYLLEAYRNKLAELPDAIDGQHGSYDTMHALCEIRRMGLNAEQSWELIDWYNDNKCLGPWEQSELERKWEGAKTMQPVCTAAEAFDDLPPLEDEEGTATPAKPAAKWSLEALPQTEFMEQSWPVTWIVDGVLCAGDCHIIGGPSKTLKTNISLDLCIAIATGTPFLNEFEVLKTGPVIFCSGESGRSRLQENSRSICNAYGLDYSSDFIIAPKVPRGDRPEQMAALAELIAKYGAIYCLLDPTYLSVGAGLAGDAAKDLNRTGAALATYNALGYYRGCTMALCHHFTKGAGRSKSASVHLSNLSGAGYVEWARQWVILNRPGVYRNDGQHELLMGVGGSAGHSGTYRVSINEGWITDERRSGGDWQVSVVDENDSVFDDVCDADGLTPDMRTLINILGDPELTKGVVPTQNFLKNTSRLNGSRTTDALTKLKTAGIIEVTLIDVKGRPRESFQLASNQLESVNSRTVDCIKA